MATKRNRPCPRRLQILAHLARRRSRFRTEAARLLEKSSQKCPPARISESPQRADQRRRCPDHRQIRCAGTQDEVICRSSPETNRRGEGLGRIRFVRREDVQIGAQRKIGATCHRRRREHGAVARVRENFGHARGARETRGAIEFALSYWFASSAA